MQAFRDHLAAAGATLLDTSWLGARAPHRVRCAAAHEVQVRPNNVANGQGICRVCSGRDSAAAETAFRTALDLVGATLLDTSWLGKDTPHRIRCAAGHLVSPTPGSVQRGNGVCRACSGSVWDVFYVVTGPAGVKFGVTSGDPRSRLADHRRDGYTAVAALHTGLADALDVERRCRTELAAAGLAPVRGREYYGADALPLVLAASAAVLSR